MFDSLEVLKALKEYFTPEEIANLKAIYEYREFLFIGVVLAYIWAIKELVTIIFNFLILLVDRFFKGLIRLKKMRS